MSQQKRRALSVEEKARIIRRIENGEQNGIIAKECGISHSTISTIWKNREKVMALFENNSLKIKRSRTSKHNVIEMVLLKWCKHQRANNVPITGSILQQKTNELAKQMGMKNFQCSTSWVQRFRARHNIVLRKVYETAGIPEATTPTPKPSEEWLYQKWPALCEGYSAQEIFSTAETLLYYNITPDVILRFRNETSTSGVQSKTKITLLVTANMTGSTKEKLLVIGESITLNCLTNFQSIIYENNTKACMTSQIFETWLRNWDEQLKAKKEKVLLLVNSDSIHSEVLNLNCIKLVILPNGTCVQPMKQVIRSFKIQYRKLQLLQMLNIEQNKKESLSFLDVLLFITEAWEKVTPNTIANAFHRAGLIGLPLLKHLKPDKDEDDLLISRLASDVDEHDTTILAQLASQLLDISVPETDIDSFINIDNSVVVRASTAKDTLKGIYDCNIKKEKTKEQSQLPSLSEAFSAVTILQKFIAVNKNYYTDVNHIVLKELKCKMQNAFELKSLKQTKMMDYFKNKL